MLRFHCVFAASHYCHCAMKGAAVNAACCSISSSKLKQKNMIMGLCGGTKAFKEKHDSFFFIWHFNVKVPQNDYQNNLGPPTKFSYITGETIYVFGRWWLKEMLNRETETPGREIMNKKECTVCVYMYLFGYVCIHTVNLLFVAVMWHLTLFKDLAVLARLLKKSRLLRLPNDS